MASRGSQDHLCGDAGPVARTAGEAALPAWVVRPDDWPELAHRLTVHAAAIYHDTAQSDLWADLVAARDVIRHARQAIKLATGGEDA